jgi:hypothetical protein
MSDKIYACLLRLFPSAFRRYYQEEALQLLRDRLRDEKGLLPRLRLTLNLMADTVAALPQAYKNSYTEFAPESSLASHFDGAPSFQALQTEPIRPAAVAMAGFLSFTALATLTFLMSRPTPYHHAARNEPRSPIESVIERLNETISPNSADSGASDAPESTSANMGRSEARPLSRPNARPSPRTRSAASAAGQPSQLREQNPDTSYSDQAPSPVVAASSSLPQGQPRTLQGVTQSAIPSNMQASTHPTAMKSLPGKLTGSFQAVGGDADLPQRFILKQDNATLSGSGGADSAEQYPILHGLVAGDSVKFELDTGKGPLIYDLTVEGKQLRGTVSSKGANGMRTTDVQLERVP